jgi:DNA-binding NarL/FixJ family response regulator
VGPVTGARPPIRLALVDDYEVVLVGVAKMFERYADRVQVVDISTSDSVDGPVDIVLFDTFAQHEADSNDITVLVDSGRAATVAVYTWSFDEPLIAAALAQGARGYLSKTLPAAELVDAIERIHAGEVVVSDAPLRSRATVGLDWPGRTEGLTEREAEVIALVTQAKSNAEIAAITYLSLNTVKTYLRNAFRKIGVRSRTEAAVWGLGHGFGIDGHRIDTWRRT